MEREKEISILIEHLKNDTALTAKRFPNLLEDTIVENGKLIEKYQAELESLKK